MSFFLLNKHSEEKLFFKIIFWFIHLFFKFEMSPLPCDIKNIDLQKSSWSDLAKNDSYKYT